ncbi:MAG TPA: hypothetical protein VFA18_08315 [Gemmataceae bacterium]|nr:hypothetical protein [Gemmataceae bacterium]
MVPGKVIVEHVFAEPFQPFEIHMASGRTFRVGHPEMVSVGKSTMIVYTPPADQPHGPERWERLSYMLIESISPLNAPVPPTHGQ